MHLQPLCFSTDETPTQRHAVELCRARGPFLWTPSTLGPLKHRRWVTRIPYDPESEFDRWLDHIWTKKYSMLWNILESFLKTNLLLWISQKKRIRAFVSAILYEGQQITLGMLSQRLGLSKKRRAPVAQAELIIWVPGAVSLSLCHVTLHSKIIQQTFCISIVFQSYSLNHIQSLHILRLGTFWRTFWARVRPTTLQVGTCCNGVWSTQYTSIHQ